MDYKWIQQQLIHCILGAFAQLAGSCTLENLPES